MILNDLQRNIPVYDEITLLHRVIEVDDLIIEILGFIKCGDELKLYILEHDTRIDENQERVRRRPREPKTNRENAIRLREDWKDRKRSMGISKIEIDGELFKVLSASMISLGERDMQSIMLVNEFIAKQYFTASLFLLMSRFDFVDFGRYKLSKLFIVDIAIRST